MSRNKNSATEQGPSDEANSGLSFFHGELTPNEDMELALHWFERGSRKGDKECDFYLGLIHESGTAVPQDIFKAIEYYQNSGTRSSMEKLGVIYELGPGFEPDYEQAAQYYRRGLGPWVDCLGTTFEFCGEPSAHNLARLILSGKIDPDQDFTVLQLLFRAWGSVLHLTDVYEDNARFIESMQALAAKAVIDDGTEDIRWAPPTSTAENMIAHEYMNECAPKIDIFFLDSLERRDPNYLYTAGSAFACGNGVPRDDHKAFEYLRLAAKQRHVEAQHMLSLIYQIDDRYPYTELNHFDGRFQDWWEQEAIKNETLADIGK